VKFKDSLAREQKIARANLLRTNKIPQGLSAESRVLWVKIMTELALIHKSSNHTGAVKQELFERGAWQLAELK
jgi:hypothetical protein